MKEQILGLQHVGLPNNDLQKTIEFYQTLGFEVVHQTSDGEVAVAFLRLGSITIETYQNGEAVGKSGALDHLALDVADVEACFSESKRLGHTLLDIEIRFLPFWTNGVKFYNIQGPNGETVEFAQML